MCKNISFRDMKMHVRKRAHHSKLQGKLKELYCDCATYTSDVLDPRHIFCLDCVCNTDMDQILYDKISEITIYLITVYFFSFFLICVNLE